MLCVVRVAKMQCYGAGSFGWSVAALYEDHKGNLWASAQTGLWRWAPGPPEHFRLPGGSDEAKALIDGDRGALLMATGISGPLAGPVTGSIEGLKQLAGGKIRDYALPGHAGQFRPTCFFRSNDGSLWIGTMQGLLHLHQGRIDKFSAADGLSANFIRDIFEDREGNVWVSTESGLDRFREFAAPTISVNQGLSTSAVYVLEATPDGSIWIDTADGLNRWQNGYVTVYGRRSVPSPNRPTVEPGLTMSENVMKIANSGLQGIIESLGQDNQGRLWVGSSEGVFYFDRGRFVQVPRVPRGNILSVAGDEHEKVWISNLDQGLLYAAPEGAVQRIPWALFGRSYATTLLPDPRQGGLWLGFFDGGIAYFKDGKIRSSYGVANGLGNGSVNDLQLGSDDAAWVATEGGLSRVKDGVVTTLTSRNGLPCDAVNSVIEDNDHSFWLYMACGMVRIAGSELDAWVSNPKRRVQTTVFDSSDGVRVRALAGGHSRLVTKSRDGKIWFSPPDGVSFIDPRHLPFNKLPPPIEVEQITADGKKYDASPRLRLPPHVRDLAIDYTALSFTAPEKVRFRYKLEGQDLDWREVVNRRQAQYSNLPPGSYRFRVIASNNSGVWNEQGAFLDFTIAPAYYQTNWFRALCAAIILALVWALHRVRIRQLQRQERRFREVIETIPAMAFTARRDGSRTFVNRRWLEFTGLSVEQAEGQGWQAAVHWDDLNRVRENWRVSVATGEPLEYETRLRGADGKYRWFLTRAVPLRDAQRNIRRWYGVTTDIEDRKQAEQSLRRSEAYLAEAQRLSHTGSFVYSPAIRQTLYWSEEVFRIFELDPRSRIPDYDETRRLVHPEDRDRVSRECLKGFGEKAEISQEYRLLLHEGIVKHLHVIWHPVLDKDGELVEYVGTAADVTERKRAEEALLRSEAYLADAQRLTRTGSWAYKPGGGAAYWSEENFRIWGFDPQQGVPDLDAVHQRIHPEDRDREIKYAESAVRAGRDFAHEFRIVLPNGEVRHLQAVGHLIFNAGGAAIEVAGTHVDVTERKRAEEERERLHQLEADLAHMNRMTMLGELASSLAHELNQPIAAAITSANACLRWLTRNPPDLERARAATIRIEKDGGRAAEIIQRLRAFYKTGAPPHRELIDINEIVREMLMLLHNEAVGHSISLRTELAPQLPQIMADRVQVQQVLMNLMLNGIEAMANGAGELTVRSQRTENAFLMISVSDTGVGLPSEKADLIFNAFYTTKPQGTGMGLAISRSIVEAHGGRLWATANAQRGATFHFTVPAGARK